MIPPDTSADFSSARLVLHEMRLREGAVPDALDGVPVGAGQQYLSGDAFLLHEKAFAFLYRKGHGITVARYGPSDPAEEELYLNGSVYAAVVCLHGLLPLHASAVALNGKVIAFTAPAGGGKSTLVAGLTRRGLPLFCDDTLALDLSDGQVRCLPGHKRLKLWPDAAELTGSPPLGQVSAAYPKVYVSPTGGDIAHVLPLGGIVFLEVGEQPLLVPIRGAEKIARLSDDHYTRQLYDRANATDAPARFALQARLAAAIPMWRFVRPLDKDRFWTMTDYLAAALGAMVPA